MRRRPERSPAIVAGIVFIALLVVVGSAVFLVLDRDPRPRLTPPPATPTLAAIPPSPTPTRRPTPSPTPRPTPSPTPRPTPSPTPTPAAATPASSAAGSTIAGRWNVTPGSWAAYRVTIIVPIFGPTDVSGRTDAISGGADIQRAAGGDEISEGRFIGDLTQLKSGDPAVDRQVAIILQTDRYPTADFVLKGPIPLPAAADRAGGAQVLLPGTITLLGQTNDVLVPATLTERDGRLTVAARYDFDPGDYGVSSDIGGIATLGDSATFEFSLIVER